MNKLRWQFSKLQDSVWKSIDDREELVIFALGMNILSEEDEGKVREAKYGRF